MKVGNRIYYNNLGQIIYQTGECQGDVLPRIENEIISYIDVAFGDETLEEAEKWHIDIENKKIIVDKFKEKVETEEERLKREKHELENQLLLQANNDLGGIL